MLKNDLLQKETILHRLLKRFFTTRFMLKPERILGDLPSSREAYGEVFKISLPAIAELMLISTIGAVDTMMVGGVGPAAIAAVGLTGQPKMIILSILMALNVGVTAVVARRKGEGNWADVNATLRNGLMISAIFGLVLTVLAVVLAEPLIRLAGAQPDTIVDATNFFRIITSVVFFQALTMTINAALRGIGRTKITFVINVTANVVVISLNYLLIGGNLGFPRLEVMGAAISTAVGTFVAFLVGAYVLLFAKNMPLHIKKGDSFRFRPDILKSIAKVSSNSIIEQIAMRIGFFLFAFQIAVLGTMEFATHQIGMQIMNFTFTFGDGLSVAGTSLVGQNLGKKRPDLSMIYGKIVQRLALAGSVLLGVSIFFSRYFLVGLFTTDSDIIFKGGLILSVFTIIQFAQTSQIVMAGGLRGAGDTRFVAMTLIFTVGFLRPFLTFLAVSVFHLGLIGAWSAILIDQSVRCALVLRRFYSFKWASIKL